MMRQAGTVGQDPRITGLEETLTSLESQLDRKIAIALRGEFMPLGASPLAEEALCSRGLGFIASAARALADAVEDNGFAAEYRYCRSELFKNPIPVLTMCARNGSYIVPSADVLASIAASNQDHQTRSDPDHHREAPVANIAVEEFPSESPVKCLVVPDILDQGRLRLVAIFSDSARRQACHHAVQILTGAILDSYSYVLHEVMLREARSRVGVFSEGAHIDLDDDGTSLSGEVFKVVARVRAGDRVVAVPLEGSVREVGIELALRRL
jgi:hypothetical protein